MCWGIFLPIGCSKENPNPQLVDPIYLDLVALREENKKALEEEKKKYEESVKGVEMAEPNTVDLKLARKEMSKSARRITHFEQQSKYYEIRAKRRELDAKESYKAAFEKGEHWPPAEEFSAYQANKRLVSASRNWNTRVPKLSDRIPSSKQAKGGKKKPEAKMTEEAAAEPAE